MTTPNHIAGGIVFTGTMCSFWNVNIFSSAIFVGVTVAFSLLPDMDSPKTLTGRCVYPLALVINRRFGHRTLTHSLFFLGLVMLLSGFVTKFFNINNQLNKIVLFALVSHLILDMLTLQGVPLLYPFKRNPCVLPADPAYRLNTSNTKSEIIVFTIFILLAFTLSPLFSQGFWTSYNRQFATIGHCNRENINSAVWVYCDYGYTKNNQKLTGSAFIIESSDKKLTLFNGHELLELAYEDKTIQINFTKPRLSNFAKRVHELNFMNIAQDSLSHILNNRVCSGLVQSNINFKYIENGITSNTTFLKLNNNFNFKIVPSIDTAKADLTQKLGDIAARIRKDSLQQLEKFDVYRKLKYRQTALNDSIAKIPDSDLYQKNKLQKELIEIRQKLKSIELKNYTIDIVLQHEREDILAQLKQQKPLLFSGYISFFIFDETK